MARLPHLFRSLFFHIREKKQLLFANGFYFIIYYSIPRIAGAQVTLPNPIKKDTFTELINLFAGLAVQVGIPIAAIFIIFAGFKFVTARGNEVELQKARKTLYGTVIGTVILVGAWVIAKAVVNFAQGL